MSVGQGVPQAEVGSAFFAIGRAGRRERCPTLRLGPPALCRPEACGPSWGDPVIQATIARATLVDGRAPAGLNLSSSGVPSVKQRLGIGTPLAGAPQECQAAVSRVTCSARNDGVVEYLRIGTDATSLLSCGTATATVHAAATL